MSLIKCKECGKEYSDKATACPKCACPTEYSIKNKASVQNDKSEKIEKKNNYINKEKKCYLFEMDNINYDKTEKAIEKYLKKHGFSINSNNSLSMIKNNQDYLDSFNIKYQAHLGSKVFIDYSLGIRTKIIHLEGYYSINKTKEKDGNKYFYSERMIPSEGFLEILDELVDEIKKANNQLDDTEKKKGFFGSLFRKK